jgi:UDPglucose--hexose-1-phosphate uridylyltransferase
MNYDSPHRRLNPLNGEWTLVSPHRARRPWLGQVEKTPPEGLPAYDPTCYLCPGNGRAGGKTNPPYTGVYVFDNDFPALLRPEEADNGRDAEGRDAIFCVSTTGNNHLFTAIPETGICRVVCFSPRHDLSLPEMAQQEVEHVLRAWSQQTEELGGLDFIKYVQVFENKGAMMGCSNPHPHSQIWATSNIPVEPGKELSAQEDYLYQYSTCLLCDTLAAERRSGERIVASNQHFTALVPFWAVWPFEILLVAHRHTRRLPDLTAEEFAGLADILRRVTARYDNLFEISFPYSMGFHQAPTDGRETPGWHLHAHFYPPLLRSASVRKFMVGYEMLAMPQRDLTPETAAERLRGLSEVHYKQRG